MDRLFGRATCVVGDNRTGDTSASIEGTAGSMKQRTRLRGGSSSDDDDDGGEGGGCTSMCQAKSLNCMPSLSLSSSSSMEAESSRRRFIGRKK
jgi:hypothetical protein